MGAHSFCHSLLRVCIEDLGLKKSDFTATKSSLGGYEVQGPERFYHYANSADCMASAIAEAMEHYDENKREAEK